MTRYSIEVLEKVMRNIPNGLIWNTMTRYAMGFMLVPTMKPLDK